MSPRPAIPATGGDRCPRPIHRATAPPAGTLDRFRHALRACPGHRNRAAAGRLIRPAGPVPRPRFPPERRPGYTTALEVDPVRALAETPTFHHGSAGSGSPLTPTSEETFMRASRYVVALCLAALALAAAGPAAAPDRGPAHAHQRRRHDHGARLPDQGRGRRLAHAHRHHGQPRQPEGLPPDGTTPSSCRTTSAMAKARSSSTSPRSTAQWGQMAFGNGISAAAFVPGLNYFEGGLPIMTADGQHVGGIGVSGDTGANDAICAPGGHRRGRPELGNASPGVRAASAVRTPGAAGRAADRGGRRVSRVASTTFVAGAVRDSRSLRTGERRGRTRGGGRSRQAFGARTSGPTGGRSRTSAPRPRTQGDAAGRRGKARQCRSNTLGSGVS